MTRLDPGIDQGPRGEAPRSLTRADLSEMRPEQVVAARQRGDLDALLEGCTRGGMIQP